METSQVTDISPTAATAPSAASLGQEDFLRMLIAQLENQDPLNPQEATEFSSQLAQFSSLEQEIAMRSSLDQISAALTGGDKSTAIDLIGRDVIAETPYFERKGGETTLRYELARATDSSVIEIRDGLGALVQSADLGPRSAGISEFRWDGTNRSGIPVPDGVYTFEVVSASDLVPVPSTSLMSGRITGANVSGGSPVLRIGEVVIPLSSIREVGDAATEDGVGQ